MDEKDVNDLLNKRKAANKELVKILSEIIESQPSQRFSQILRNYGFIEELPSNTQLPEASKWINEFYTEPDKILARVQKITESLKKIDN